MLQTAQQERRDNFVFLQHNPVGAVKTRKRWHAGCSHSNKIRNLLEI